MNASGFSKEIQEFDKVLDDMNANENGESADEESEDENESSTLEKKSLAENESNAAISISSNPVESGPKEEDPEDQEAYDNFNEEAYHEFNKQFSAYRDVKKSANPDDEEASDEVASVTSTTSTIMDPSYVRSRVRKSLMHRIKTEKRRIRNKGESAMVTQQLRDINDTIKSSLFF